MAMPRNTSEKKLSVIFESEGQGTLNDIAVKEFHGVLAKSSDAAVAVAAIKALTAVIRSSNAQTMMGLGKELEEAAQALQRVNPTAISLKAGCELFLRYTTRTSALELSDIATAKARLIERGNTFADTSLRARNTIAELGSRFIRNNAVVLTHGYSRVVLSMLARAMSAGIHFSVIVTEGRPDAKGIETARALDNLQIPVTLVLDSAVGYVMERADMVLVGAEAVVENGGIVNKLGTYQMAVCAKACNRPFYVAAESYKFARLYPLTQKDLPEEKKPSDLGPLLPHRVMIDNPSRDYTPPTYISLLVTDLGVLTPAAVSDELIQLYS
mmetsp:Transcript_6201/g.13519  ORF Transcript_6201/g.13519 Transcript_6201/m.13519 type:complete len:327 (+) Transcript_6201:160-1140(+)|eukprot:CAMPEP_0202902300 /NCGR_PEP_ID=MMETSP1392-20130828/16778_1 /ASSEMBLY_ACC=CAM_ASM_000868 /TAXON_ID=225041 /ORGANISM="Chlamydomonas chlamydogama, Strain SAG 11-48b" /LENGTH=326 /DNA_ID=CAMNT_0049589047 /DNA_START=159 /DNA_END=1139 /DNA_ORIENTATION=-